MSNITRETKEVLVILGENIRAARMRRKLAAGTVAELAGISRSTLWAVEKGTPSVAIGTYAAVLHVIDGKDKDFMLVANKR